MKRTVALGFALSLFGATAAFAASEPGHSASVSPVAASHLVGPMAAANNDLAKPVKPFNLDVNSKVLVAENSPAFGSKYQRY